MDNTRELVVFLWGIVTKTTLLFMSVLKFLLLPFAMLYDVIMGVRNKLYDMKLKPSTSFDIPVISVGNLAVGGTGKTPMTEHLIRVLSPQYKVATLSRGYGRKTKGFKIANEQDDASTIGDEPFQIYKKFSKDVHVAVGEERALAIPTLLQEHSEIEVVILDDAFQHRSVIPGLSILLTECNRPFFDDHILPYGRLREGPEGANRAHVIIVTKCPSNFEEEKMMRMEQEIRTYSPKPVFFSRIRYNDPVPFGDPTKKISRNIILLTAIANAQILEEYIQKNFTLIKHFSFRDHYVFKASDLEEVEQLLKAKSGESISIITTEKDKVKLERNELKPYLSRLPIFYLPIETEFLRNGKDFDALVTSFLNSFKPSFRQVGDE
jgi:tetraacyldisaccharide 4'-kinase